MDDLARKAGADPIAFRRGMLGKTPRLQAVLDPKNDVRVMSVYPSISDVILRRRERREGPGGDIVFGRSWRDMTRHHTVFARHDRRWEMGLAGRGPPSPLFPAISYGVW
jgi:hypothetical protein